MTVYATFHFLARIQGRLIRSARVLLGWTQKDLAKKARVHPGTVKRLEKSDKSVRVQYDTVQRVMECLQRHGITFLDDDEPGLRLRPVKNRPH